MLLRQRFDAFQQSFRCDEHAPRALDERLHDDACNFCCMFGEDAFYLIETARFCRVRLETSPPGGRALQARAFRCRHTDAIEKKRVKVLMKTLNAADAHRADCIAVVGLI